MDELRRIRQARKRRERADESVRSAILAALAAGAPVQAIADAAGITRQRVWQIRKETR